MTSPTEFLVNYIWTMNNLLAFDSKKVSQSFLPSFFKNNFISCFQLSNYFFWLLYISMHWRTTNKICTSFDWLNIFFIVYRFLSLHRAPYKNKTCQSSPEDWFKRRQRSEDNQHDVAPRTHVNNSSSRTNKSADLKTRSGLIDGLNKQTGKVWF